MDETINTCDKLAGAKLPEVDSQEKFESFLDWVEKENTFNSLVERSFEYFYGKTYLPYLGKGPTQALWKIYEKVYFETTTTVRFTHRYTTQDINTDVFTDYPYADGAWGVTIHETQARSTCLMDGLTVFQIRGVCERSKLQVQRSPFYLEQKDEYPK